MLDSSQMLAFLAIVRTGTTLAAARRLGVDHSTVARRLTRLEAALGVRLFDRSPRGLAPTDAATALIPHAERIESELITAAGISAEASAATGSVRLATPEIFGTWLVAPNMAQLYQLHPGLTLELAPESRSISLSKREADIAITPRQPPQGRLVVRKLTDYRLGLYGASASAERGSITSPADLAGARFVWYIDELLDYPELSTLNEAFPGAVPVFRSSSSAAQQSAVAAGIGLGMLHVLAADQDPRLQRILPEVIEVRRSYWLVVHADQQRTPRVRAVIAFLTDLVDRMRTAL
jgi:DNA-binding transcriptional LysR family regulator